MSTSLGERLATIVERAREIVAAADSDDLDAALTAAYAIPLEVSVILDVLDGDYWHGTDSASRFDFWNETGDGQ